MSSKVQNFDSSQEQEPIIEVSDLVKDYELNEKQIRVLQGTSMNLYTGEKLAISGKSGVGKSTLLHILGTLDQPTEGNVLFEGQDVFSFSEKKRAAYRNRSIGFVFQFHYLLPDFTALENVVIPAKIAKVENNQVLDRARKLLEEVGLGDRVLHKPGELSGGEQQRVAIARALIMKPKILLADEPTGNLDRHTSKDIHKLLCELNEEYKTTMVVVTHNLELADLMDRRLILADGLISEYSNGMEQ